MYGFTTGGRHYAVISDRSGANRVYALREALPDQSDAARIVDVSGVRWRVTEDALVSERSSGNGAPRVDAQRAFWFGWFAQFPDTVLLK